MRSVPAGAETRAPRSKDVAVGGGPRKGPAKPATFRIGSPENDANIEAPCDGSIKLVEQRDPAVRRLEIGRVEGDREPHAVPCRINSLGDSPEGGLAIDEGPYRISGP